MGENNKIILMVYLFILMCDILMLLCNCKYSDSEELMFCLTSHEELLCIVS